MDPLNILPPNSIVAWADRLQALARAGRFYAQNDYDRERYDEILGIAAEMAATVANISASRIKAHWESDPGHVTPRISVGAVIFDESGALLLLKRPESDYWALPVGFAEVSESAAQGVAREVREETGLIVTVERLLGVYDCRGPHLLHQLYNIIFQRAVEGGALTRAAEAPDHGYFEPSALPPLLPHHRPSIEDAFASQEKGWSGARFDR